MAIVGPRDEVLLTWRDDARIVVVDSGHPDLPSDPAQNSASAAAQAVLRSRCVHRGFDVAVTKRLPLYAGQGGSAASAVAGALAACHLAGLDLDSAELLTCALEGEAVASGRQADNLAPSLLGGFVLIRSVDPMDVIRLPVPSNLRIVLAHPSQRLATRDARAALPTSVTRDVAVKQSAHVAAMVAGAFLGDLALLGRGLVDLIAEPARSSLLPGFIVAKEAAMAAGALGASISGAGPTAFALADGHSRAALIADAMQRAYRDAGVCASVRITEVELEGAKAW